MMGPNPAITSRTDVTGAPPAVDGPVGPERWAGRGDRAGRLDGCVETGIRVA